MGVLSFLARRPLSAGVPLVLVTHLLAAAAGALFWHAAPRLAIDIPFTDSELVIFEGGSGARLASAAEDLRTRTTERDEARRSRDQWQASYRQSETNRSAERQRAADRIASLEADHAIELEAARQAAANAVRIIYREPEFDDTNCPLRSMFGNDELRDAIGAIAADPG